METVYFYKSPAGILGITEENNSISKVFFADKKSISREHAGENPLIKMAVRQLDEYFKKKRKIFDLPLSPHGTDFQRSVWKALQSIPYGETRSYMDIAAEIGNPKACRAVGMANNRNPIVIIIPCHRVIGKDKSLTGYGGGLEIKQFLLELEGLSVK